MVKETLMIGGKEAPSGKGYFMGDFVLLAWVLMPDHFHLVRKRIESESISAIIGNIKRFTSRRIRELLRKEGALSILGALREAAERERAAYG